MRKYSVKFSKNSLSVYKQSFFDLVKSECGDIDFITVKEETDAVQSNNPNQLFDDGKSECDSYAMLSNASDPLDVGVSTNSEPNDHVPLMSLTNDETVSDEISPGHDESALNEFCTVVENHLPNAIPPEFVEKSYDLFGIVCSVHCKIIDPSISEVMKLIMITALDSILKTFLDEFKNHERKAYFIEFMIKLLQPALNMKNKLQSLNEMKFFNLIVGCLLPVMNESNEICLECENGTDGNSKLAKYRDTIRRIIQTRPINSLLSSDELDSPSPIQLTNSSSAAANQLAYSTSSFNSCLDNKILLPSTVEDEVPVDDLSFIMRYDVNFICSKIF